MELNTSDSTSFIFSAKSLGTNRIAPYDKDLGIAIEFNNWSANYIAGILDHGVTTADDWKVKLLIPDSVDGVKEIAVDKDTTTVINNISFPGILFKDGYVSYRIDNNLLKDPPQILSIGPRALIVMKKNGTTDNFEIYGNPVYLTLRPGATHVVNFYHE